MTKNEINKVYSRTKKGIITTIYGTQRFHSKNRGHRLPEYTKQELKEWLDSQTLFHELYSEWINSDYKKDLKPSVDRKHNDIHYCMSNIALTTWGDNKAKGHEDSKTAKLNTGMPKKPVEQYTKEGIYMNTYISTREAARVFNLKSSSSIADVCKGRAGCKTAGGFIWKYAGGVPSV